MLQQRNSCKPVVTNTKTVEADVEMCYLRQKAFAIWWLYSLFAGCYFKATKAGQLVGQSDPSPIANG